MAFPLYQVDAFTDAFFAGNPAAVCLLGKEMPREDWMQSVAAEMNLSETAFVGTTDRRGEYRLRWFTPAAEVELCGHATLAAAHLLWELGEADRAAPITFHTRFRGALTCSREAGSDGDRGGGLRGEIAMDFPADPPAEAEPPAGLTEALGKPRVIHAAKATYDWIIELESEEAVRELTPDFAALARFDCRGAAVTARARADRPYDIASRFFAPRLRVAEDPVTGSLHCALGPYWQARLGRPTIEAYQASSRGGRLRVHTDADRVTLVSRAVTVMRGELLTPPACEGP